MSGKIKYYHDIEQGSDEWLNARLGIVTASEANNIVTPTGKLASGDKVHSYACDIAAQRANMQIEDTFQSFDMMRGHFQEEIARDIYAENYEDVKECGFVVRDFGSFKIGASPDGLIGDDGALEIKSRVAKFQVKTIVSGEVPKEYVNQLQTVLLVTDRKWIDFVQYSNGMPLFVKRVFPDPIRQRVIKEAAETLEVEISNALAFYAESSKKMLATERVEFTMCDEITSSGEE